MDIIKAAKARRSVRSFRAAPVPEDLLEAMVDAARVGPSAANRQPLEYVAVTEPGLCREVFDCLKWAAYIAPRGTPAPGARPTAYVAVARNRDYELAAMSAYDVGAAIQTMMLIAVENGLGSCWLKSVNIPKASQALGLPGNLELDSVLALGYPAEEPRQVDLEPGQEGLEVIKYWRDENEQHFVPKRALEKVLHKQKFGGK